MFFLVFLCLVMHSQTQAQDYISLTSNEVHYSNLNIAEWFEVLPTVQAINETHNNIGGVITLYFLCLLPIAVASVYVYQGHLHPGSVKHPRVWMTGIVLLIYATVCSVAQTILPDLGIAVLVLGLISGWTGTHKAKQDTLAESLAEGAT